LVQKVSGRSLLLLLAVQRAAVHQAPVLLAVQLAAALLHFLCASLDRLCLSRH
jgi:hypothetical protein